MPETCINNCDGFEQPHSGSESARVIPINDWAKQVKTSNLHVTTIINLHTRLMAMAMMILSLIEIDSNILKEKNGDDDDDDFFIN